MVTFIYSIDINLLTVISVSTERQLAVTQRPAVPRIRLCLNFFSSLTPSFDTFHLFANKKSSKDRTET